ncbi:MAG TPA: hypothetical protein VHC90_20000 [Bryobacteraceae bacterium]|nr:hypothetical protein [Bryobacteraceae bacterium]
MPPRLGALRGHLAAAATFLLRSRPASIVAAGARYALCCGLAPDLG